MNNIKGNYMNLKNVVCVFNMVFMEMLQKKDNVYIFMFSIIFINMS